MQPDAGTELLNRINQIGAAPAHTPCCVPSHSHVPQTAEALSAALDRAQLTGAWPEPLAVTALAVAARTPDGSLLARLLLPSRDKQWHTGESSGRLLPAALTAV